MVCVFELNSDMCPFLLIALRSLKVGLLSGCVSQWDSHKLLSQNRRWSQGRLSSGMGMVVGAAYAGTATERTIIVFSIYTATQSSLSVISKW